MKNIKYKSFKDCKTIKQKISYILSIVITVLLVFILFVGLVGGWLYLIQDKSLSSVHASSVNSSIFETEVFSFYSDDVSEGVSSFSLGFPTSRTQSGHGMSTEYPFWVYMSSSSFYLIDDSYDLIINQGVEDGYDTDDTSYSQYVSSVWSPFSSIMSIDYSPFIFAKYSGYLFDLHEEEWQRNDAGYLTLSSTPSRVQFAQYAFDEVIYGNILQDTQNRDFSVIENYYLNVVRYYFYEDADGNPLWFYNPIDSTNFAGSVEYWLCFPVSEVNSSWGSSGYNVGGFDNYDLGYTAGYIQGKQYKSQDIENRAYTDGYSVGEQVGYSSGYNVGYNDGLNVQWGDIDAFTAIKNGVDNLLDIRLFGVVSIGTLFTIAFGFLLVSLLLKFIMGG